MADPERALKANCSQREEAPRQLREARKQLPFQRLKPRARILTPKHKGHPSQRADFITIFAIVSENFVGGSRQISGLRPVET